MGVCPPSFVKPPCIVLFMSHCMGYTKVTAKELTPMKPLIPVVLALLYFPLGVILALAKSYK